MMDTERPRLTLAYCWGMKNAGDIEIVAGALRFLRQAVPEYQVTVISRYAEAEPGFRETAAFVHQVAPDVEVVPSPFPWFGEGVFESVLRGVVSGGLVALTALAPGIARSTFRPKAVKAFEESSMVLVNGGNLFYWNTARKAISREIALAFPAVWALRNGVPYGFLPQSLGTFEGAMARRLFSRLFSNAGFIITRDSMSTTNVTELPGVVASTSILAGVDMAFYCDDVDDKAAETIIHDKGLTNRKFVTVTLRATRVGDTGPLGDSETDLITNKMTQIIEGLLSKRSISVLLVSQTVKDIEITRDLAVRIGKRFPGRCAYVSEMVPSVLRGVYRRSLLLLGMRLHSLIFAMSVGAPAVGLFESQWGPKTPGTFEALGIPDLCFNIQAIPVNGVLDTAIAVLDSRDSYEKRIRKALASCLDRQMDFLQRMVRHCVGSSS